MSDSEDESSSSAGSWPVTDTWLQGVLKAHHTCSDHCKESEIEITIVEFSVKPGCSLGESVLSDILAVNVDYKLKTSESDSDCDTIHLDLIIKLLPQDPFSRFFVTEAQFDLREICFYTRVIPDLNRYQQQLSTISGSIQLPIPVCYHAHYTPGNLPSEGSPEPPESVLVLEDLRPLGYKAACLSVGLDLIQSKAAIRAIANVHALSLCYKIKENIDLMEKYPFLFQTSKATESYQQLVERGLPQLSRFLAKRAGMENELQALEQLRPNTRTLIEKLLQPKEPVALITHTDFWCNNLLFNMDDADGKCAILDWQMVTYSRPTNDIALLIISSLPTDLRREHTSTLLHLYYDVFSDICQSLGVDLSKDLQYEFESLEVDYKQSQLLALLLCIGSVDVALGNPNAEQRLLDVLTDLYEEGVLSTNIIMDSDF